MATTAKFRIWRGDSSAGQFVDYSTEVETGMVVLDAVLLFLVARGLR